MLSPFPLRGTTPTTQFILSFNNSPHDEFARTGSMLLPQPLREGAYAENLTLIPNEVIYILYIQQSSLCWLVVVELWPEHGITWCLSLLISLECVLCRCRCCHLDQNMKLEHLELDSHATKCLLAVKKLFIASSCHA